MMRIPLLRGRDFSETDTHQTTKVAIVNEVFAERYFPNETPIGKSVEVKAFGIGKAEIVGVVGNVRSSLDEHPNPELYHCYSQVAVPIIHLMVRTGLDQSALEQNVRRIISSLDPQQPVSFLGSFDQDLADAMGYPKFRTRLMAIFAGLAVLLVIIGIYTLIDYHAKSKTVDIGIRVALGADREKIFRVVMREAVIIIIGGLLLGIPTALITNQLLRNVVYGTEITDLASYSVATLLISLIVFLAALIPSLKATRIDPTEVLRNC